MPALVFWSVAFGSSRVGFDVVRVAFRQPLTSGRTARPISCCPADRERNAAARFDARENA
jgi:hypothetical protein